MPLKPIRSKAELAINDAPSALDGSLHIERPNIHNRDIFWTFAHKRRFTNMTMLLFSASVIIFLIGLLSEQITAFTHKTGAWNVFGVFRVSTIAGHHGG